jgi:uncharacterized protein (TIGR03067 family)
MDDIDRLQGIWKQVACERDGLPVSAEELAQGPRTHFMGDTFVVTLADGSVLIRGTFKLDPTQNPKWVDWTDTFGADAGKTFPAIYSLDGDRFVFCAADDGQERPTEFRTRPRQVLRIHKREPVRGER